MIEPVLESFDDILEVWSEILIVMTCVFFMVTVVLTLALWYLHETKTDKLLVQ